jgi:hypothetical protein
MTSADDPNDDAAQAADSDRVAADALSDEAFFRALGDEPTAEQHDTFARLNAETRRKVRRRAYALANGLSASRMVALTGDRVANVYRLRKAWADTGRPRLYSIVSYSARPIRSSQSGDNIESTRAVAREIVEEQYERHLKTGKAAFDVRELTVRDFAARIRDRLTDKIAAITLQSIARDVRQEERNKPVALWENYGRRIVCDVSAISLTVTEAGLAAAPINVAIVVEEYSQLILAAIPCLQQDGSSAQKRSIEHAIDKVRGGLEANLAARTEISVVAGPHFGPLDAEWTRRIEASLGKDRVISTGRRRYGQLLLDPIGPFLGRLKFIPRATEGGEADAAAVRALGREPMEFQTAASILRRSVDQHNAEIVARLVQVGAVDPTGPNEGPMLSVLKQAVHVDPPPRTDRIMA